MTARPPEGDLAPGAMTEYLTDEWGFFIRSARVIEKFRSQFQDVEVHDSKPFGRRSSSLHPRRPKNGCLSGVKR